MVNNKTAAIPQLVSEISDQERQVAKDSIKAFKTFLNKLWSARKGDRRIVSALEQHKDADPETIFEIRHLLRKSQREIRDKYKDIIIMFAGEQNSNMDAVSTGVIHILKPLENDTTTRKVKIAVQDAMQQLSGFLEEFLEAFDEFHDPDQISKIINTSHKAETIVQSIENIVDEQLIKHFERNILSTRRLGSVSDIRGRIQKRARLIKLLGE